MLNRRALLSLGSSVWASTLLGTNLSAIAAVARDNSAHNEFAALSPELSRGLEAFAARIIPSGDTPGAREAGAIWFIDAAMAGEMANALPLLEGGMRSLNAQSNGDFAQLSEEAQDSRLAAIEGESFFELTRALVIAGTFTMPKHGGNKDNVGWNLLGYESRHFWEAPFGYYDGEIFESKEKSAQLSDDQQVIARAHHGSHSS